MYKRLRVFSFVFYVIALISVILYFILDFKSQISPHIRLTVLARVCLSLYFASLLLAKTLPNEKAKKLMKCTFFSFFVLYLLLLTTLVLFDSYFGRVGVANIPKWSREAFEKYFAASVNLVPFKTISEFIARAFVKNISMKALITNIFGNLAAFAPFAFFLPLFSEKMRSFKRFLATMIIIVICAEISQTLLLTGACDIDDLILNVGGACVTYIILRMKYVSDLIKKITMI